MAVQSFNQILFDYACQRRQQTAISCGESSISYRELDLQSNRLARHLKARGVKANDLVTFAIPNSIEFFVVCFALWKLGATPQPVSFRLPKKELDAIAELAGTPFVVTQDDDLNPDGYPDTPLPDVLSKYWKAPTSGGSTGRPKLIVSTIAAEIDPKEDSITHQPIDSVVLIPGPLYHNGPFMTAIYALLRGNQLFVLPKFDAEQCLRLIDRYKVTWTVMVPTMMHRIWRLDDTTKARYDLSSLNVLLHFAAPCPAWLKMHWIEWIGADSVYELYGGAEGHGYSLISGSEWLEHKGSVGRWQGDCEIKVVDKQGKQLPPGEAGELYFLPAAGQGSTYYYIGAETGSLEGGWESLGDIGYLDKDGYLYLCDRKKDMILSGGANIYPAEVEGAIESHPSVRSAIVVGLPDDDLGQRVHALVDAPSGLNQQDLCDFLADELVRYKIPRTFEFVKEPLRDDAGKARRSAIAAGVSEKDLSL